MKQFIRRNRVELIAALLALLGIFLLVEQIQIRATIFAAMRAVWRTLSRGIWTVVSAVVNRILHTTVSDVIGLGLIALAILIMLWRVRFRLRSQLANGEACPLCGGKLRRIHRHWQDHLLSLLLPVGRYRCRNSECRWEGVRARTPR